MKAAKTEKNSKIYRFLVSAKSDVTLENIVRKIWILILCNKLLSVYIVTSILAVSETHSLPLKSAFNYKINQIIAFVELKFPFVTNKSGKC